MTELLDRHGQPVRKRELTRELAAPRVGGVRTVWTHSVASGLTPARLASLLQGAVDGDPFDYLTLAEELEERDHHYRSVLGTRKLAVAGLEVVVEAAGDGAREEALADAVRELIAGGGFDHAVFDLLDGLGKGFSVVELLWQTRDRQWWPRYAWRDPRFFTFDRDTHTELRLRDEAAPAEGVALPPYKFIRHVPHLKTGVPIRRGLARLAVWGYLFKAYTVKDWMAFLEVYGMPMRVGRYGPNATDQDIRNLMSAVVNLGADAAAVMHESMRIEFQHAVQGQGQNQLFEHAAAFWDRQLSKAILGQTASTEGTAGKLGNEELQAEVRQDLIRADAKDLNATLNRDLVRPFIDLNYGHQQAYPQLRLYLPEPEDLAQLTESLAKLVPLGLQVGQGVVRDKLGLPDPDDDEDLLAPPAAPAPPEGAANAANASGPTAAVCPVHGVAHGAPALNQAETGFEALDEIELEALEDWEAQMGPVIDPLRQAVEEATDYDDLVRRLTELLGEMDVDALARTLGEALFKAKGAGDVGAD